MITGCGVWVISDDLGDRIGGIVGGSVRGGIGGVVVGGIGRGSSSGWWHWKGALVS